MISIDRFILTASILATAVAAQSDWRKLAPDGRSGHGMAFHIANGTVVAFGGLDQSGDVLGETWVWDSVAWVLADPAGGPAPRTDCALAYDIQRGRTVLFGGLDANGAPLGDTWEWDGAGWTQVPVMVGPPARSRHAMIYDAQGRSALLFGGLDASGTPLGDTWEWDGTGWVQATPSTNPPARAGHAIAYETARGRVVMFGGRDTGGLLGDTWQWNGINWSLSTPNNAPPPLERHAMAYDPVASRVVLRGGRDSSGNLAGGSYLWTGIDWNQVIQSVAPPLRAEHAMVSDVKGGRVIMVGGIGKTGGRFADTWEWNGSWGQADSSPPNLSGHAAAFHAGNGRMVVFGGEPGFQTGLTSATYEWDGSRWLQPPAFSRPTARRDHALAYDPGRDRTVLFGGTDDVLPLGDTWEWDGALWHQATPATSPVPRLGHAMVWDAARGRVVLFGGATGLGGADYQDTWEFDGATWTQRLPANVPPARFWHAMAYDAARERVVLFGGIDAAGSVYRGDTWEWDGNDWTQRHPATAPVPRFHCGMTFDPVRARVLLQGGLAATGAARSDTWEWDGNDWVALAPQHAPPGRRGHSMVFYPPGGHVITSGGDEGGVVVASTYFSDTWAHESSAPASFAPFGTGCAGSAGIPALAAAPYSLPWLGDVFTAETTGLPAGALAFTGVGFSNTTWGGIALPAALAPFGLGTCTLYASLDLAVPTPVAGGAATFALPLPADPRLIGFPFYLQCVALGAGGANPLGGAVSNAGAAVIGSR